MDYWAALARRAPLDELVSSLLPPESLRSTWWVDLPQVVLQTKYKWKKRGIANLCIDGQWDIQDVRPRISAYKLWGNEKDPWRSDYETMRVLLLEGGDCRETPQFKRHSQKIEAGIRSSRADTLEDLPKYFDGLRDTFESMKQNGFLTQEELGKAKDDEMRLHVTRTGQLCYGGRACHRIAMAELAGIRWAPFIYESVHPLWVARISKEFDLPPHSAILQWVESDTRVRQQRPL